MAETKNIGEMAAILARKILPKLYWEEVQGPADTSWPCEKPEHKKKDHPTDAVYRFIHPYTGRENYIIFDFKSMASDSIQPTNIVSSLKSMALTLDCSKVSETWNRRYAGDASHDNIGGLLVYNRDDAYKRDLARHVEGKLFDSFPEQWPQVTKRQEIIIIDPETITFLNSMYSDLAELESEKQIPDMSKRGFFHPNKILNDNERLLAPLDYYETPLLPDQIDSNIIFRCYYSESEKFDFLVYYRDKGESHEEFMYLFDQLISYQIVSQANTIQIRAYDPVDDAFPLFKRAKELFAAYSSHDDFIVELMMERLDMITFTSFDKKVPKFYEVEVGMPK
ncbi:hypothetical protein [Leucothrix arctica]|uniref:GAPS4 PD-(D/E)XK nuclease domain-containing protein n=1 Tax=Leucothrix arctica TaxID=1481894 RepID=A0A317CFD4_9GAMM|nr:hypothetical protein [Leucothrix arctica]PWQ94872.1 hypothetical protein DKT75_14060 [Leucothrix arctica]